MPLTEKNIFLLNMIYWLKLKFDQYLYYNTSRYRYYNTFYWERGHHNYGTGTLNDLLTPLSTWPDNKKQLTLSALLSLLTK